MEGSRLIFMGENGRAADTRQRAKQWRTDTIQRTADGRGGAIQIRCDSEEEKWRREQAVPF